MQLRPTSGAAFRYKILDRFSEACRTEVCSIPIHLPYASAYRVIPTKAPIHLAEGIKPFSIHQSLIKVTCVRTQLPGVGCNTELFPIVESIITNSNELYDSSKDFLWNLNHNSDDPLEVFPYLTAHGQVFYNQFCIPFSAAVKGDAARERPLAPFAALNLIYIFKEAMTNVIKHAAAGEVVFACCALYPRAIPSSYAFP